MTKKLSYSRKRNRRKKSYRKNYKRKNYKRSNFKRKTKIKYTKRRTRRCSVRGGADRSQEEADRSQEEAVLRLIREMRDLDGGQMEAAAPETQDQARERVVRELFALIAASRAAPETQDQARERVVQELIDLEELRRGAVADAARAAAPRDPRLPPLAGAAAPPIVTAIVPGTAVHIDDPAPLPAPAPAPAPPELVCSWDPPRTAYQIQFPECKQRNR